MHKNRFLGICLAAAALTATSATSATSASATPTAASCVSALCLWTGTNYSGGETALRGSVADLSAIGASYIGSDINGDSVCWRVYSGKNYTGTYPILIPNGNHTSDFGAGLGHRWYSARRTSGTCT